MQYTGTCLIHSFRTSKILAKNSKNNHFESKANQFYSFCSFILFSNSIYCTFLTQQHPSKTVFQISGFEINHLFCFRTAKIDTNLFILFVLLKKNTIKFGNNKFTQTKREIEIQQTIEQFQFGHKLSIFFFLFLLHFEQALLFSTFLASFSLLLFR